MLIKLLISRAIHNGEQVAGQIIEVPEREGLALIMRKQAEEVGVELETAAVEPVRQTATRKYRKKRKR